MQHYFLTFHETCSVAKGWSCKQANTYIDVCSQGCGDGVVAISEQCDDGSNANGDGCSALCQVETGWKCSASQVTDIVPLCAVMESGFPIKKAVTLGAILMAAIRTVQ